jgi:hypothetical protein
LAWVLEEFKKALEKTKVGVGHNIDFDYKIVGAEFFRKNIENNLQEIPKQIPWNWEQISVLYQEEEEEDLNLQN